MTTLDRLLAGLGACEEARIWARGYPTLDAAWAACPRADWLLWLAGRLVTRRGSVAHRRLVLATCAVARTALPYVPVGEPRPLAALDTAERWARQEAGGTVSQVEQAAEATTAAALDALEAARIRMDTSLASVHAATAALSAVRATAMRDTDVAATGAGVAVYAADATITTAGPTHRAAALAALAALVRRHYPMPPERARARRSER